MLKSCCDRAKIFVGKSLNLGNIYLKALWKNDE
ncbi:hypothetical protein FIC_01916 [Flavobacteriaceae bacterium 3519-10]|nr:hypothetical protein FIC_01916 [Flavobacteriaceae bacterium 3519-10]